LVLSLRSAVGPTQDGQPFSQGHAVISSSVRFNNVSQARYSGSLNPIPPVSPQKREAQSKLVKMVLKKTASK
jgi:hypothetical protein